MRDSVYTAQKTASPSLAIINVRNLRLRTLIGFNADEKVKKQDVVLNIEIKYAIGDAVFQDQVEDALNYKVITKNVIRHVEQGQFLLLEKLVSDVLGICSDHPSIHYSKVTIDKPHALRFADSVSLTLEHQSTTASIHNYLEKAS